ncbi:MULTISPECIES: serine/threonine-protein kinase [Corallococcus]|uniref:serine/threonine protein kinase n=1 Tax=Corallococcus TaxID=83461 RepID=UPI00117EC8A4|nr:MULTISPECIES: serine/threonine-protein kinase [Corallococcus]NBD14418.1 protein kinase [Corallococcus silvisoli]TSC27371.1 serine/threonine protein kinase [Corallococcus sp. Z5C101001]
MSTAPTESPRFFGRYELVHLLGQGGMGEVYLAKLSGAAGFEKPCIVKTILPGLVKDRQFLDRFHHEAKVLVHLVHSSIAQVYDMGEADGTYYMALEYVAGVDLGYLLEQARSQGRAVPAPVALYIGQRIAEGLGYAHRKTGTDGEPLGIVHRDVSPHNVMVSYEGEVKVIDFGLAKSTARSKYTLPSTVMGKLGYMSPEQVRAEPLDHRSDIYSCAVVVWEMLAGRGLVPHGTVGEMMAAMSNPVVPSLTDFRPDVEPPLEAAVRRALAPLPADRYARADDFGRSLNAELLRTGAPVGAEEVGEFVRAVCPEAFAEQRKLTSGVHGERRTPSPAARSGSSGTGLYGAGNAADGAAFDATALRTVGPPDGGRRDTGRIETEGSARGPSGTFVSHSSGSGGVARNNDAVDAAALGATAVHLPATTGQAAAAVGTPAAPEQALARPERGRPVARIAMAALLLVGASVGLTTYVLRSSSTPARPPPAVRSPPPAEPVVATPPKVEPPPPPVVAPSEEPPVIADSAAPDAGMGVEAVRGGDTHPGVKPAPGTKRPVRQALLVSVDAPLVEIKETGGGQRVANTSVPSGINAGAVFQVVGPRARGARKHPLLGTATVLNIKPDRKRMTLRLDAEADAAKEPRFVVLATRAASVPVAAPAPAEPTPVAAPVREEKPAAPRELLGKALVDGLLGSNFNRTLTLINDDTISWSQCRIILARRQQALMAGLEPYREHKVKTGAPYFSVQASAPMVAEQVVRVICKEGQADFPLRKQ